MKQINHQFRTDLKRLRMPLLVFAILLLWKVWLVIYFLETGVFRSQLVPSEWPLALTLAEWLPFLGALWLGTLVFWGDPAHTVTAYWRTLPWSRAAMGLAKALFLTVCVAMPVGFASLAEPLWFRVSTPDLLAEFVGETSVALLWLWAVWLVVGVTSRWTMGVGFALMLASISVFMNHNYGQVFHFLHRNGMPAILHWSVWAMESSIAHWIYALPQQMSGAIPVWLTYGFGFPLLAFIHYASRKRRLPIAAALLGLALLPVVTVMVFSFGNKNSTMAITAHQPVHERTSVWQLDEANRSRNSETKITAFLTSAKRNEYARLRAHEVYPLIEGQPGKASARLIETTSKTKLAEFLGMTGEQTRSMQAEVTGRQPFTKIGIPLSLHGWAEFEISTMSSWTRFTLDHTTRKDGLVCWVSKRKPESELEPVEPPPMKGSGPYVIRMTYHQLADPRFVVKVQACSRRWIKLRQIWRGEPRVQFVAALWKPEERCYLDGVVGSAQGEDYSHFELGKVSEDELDAARIDVIRLTDTQIVREEFADESVIVYLPKP